MRYAILHCLSACIIYSQASNPINRNTKRNQPNQKRNPSNFNTHRNKINSIPQNKNKIVPRTSSNNEKPVFLPDDTIKVFVRSLKNNADDNATGLGLLLSPILDKKIEVTYLIIPKQRASKVTPFGWKEVKTYRDEKRLQIIGEIRINFNKNGNLSNLPDEVYHPLFYFQRKFSCAISIVCNQNLKYKIYRLTKIGLRVIGSCPYNGPGNHNHKRKNELLVKPNYHFIKRWVDLRDFRRENYKRSPNNGTKIITPNTNDNNNKNTGERANSSKKKTTKNPKWPKDFLLLPQDTFSVFYKVVAKDVQVYGPYIETIGFFYGNTGYDVITVTHLVIPQQLHTNEYSMETAEGLQEMNFFGDNNGLKQIGNIHTHSHRYLVLSDGDCFALKSCQKKFSLYVMGVCWPDAGYKLYRLTQPGMQIVENTQKTEEIDSDTYFNKRGDVITTVPHHLISTNIVLKDFRKD